MDGVLPLLQAFFDNLFSPPDEGEDGRDIQLRVTNKLLSNLMVNTDGYTVPSLCSAHAGTVVVSMISTQLQSLLSFHDLA